MKKTLIIVTFLIFVKNFSQIPVTKIYTDFNTFWISGTSLSPNPIKPNKSHNLLGFSWNGITYSTGVDDNKLSSNGIAFQAQEFTAFPTSIATINPGGSTFIGVGQNYGGVGNSVPIPVENNLVKYLTDGSNGLDLGTGIFNFPKSGEISYDITSINPYSVGDGIPDILITQIGDISNVLDKYYFVDISNNVVGNQYQINFGNIPDLGNADWKFYNANISPPAYNTSVSSNPARKMRLLALDWAELGLNTSNISQVKKMVQVFSGQSDIAFTAYNRSSIILKMSVSGRVFNDNDAGIPDGSGYSGATVRLKDSSGNTIASTISDINGYYTFPNISGGTYSIELLLPNNFVMVGNTDGNLNNFLPITVANEPVIDKNFGINQPPFAGDDNLLMYLNTPISFNIAENDFDFNSGSIIAGTISFVVPNNATNIVMSNGYIKSFTIVGEGTWYVDESGIFTFTPELGYYGIPASVKYVIKDNAGLVSNEALLSVEVKNFCFRASVNIGNVLSTTHGITSLGRAGANGDNWPMIRKGAWTALEAKTKGFVVNRIPTTAQVEAIADPVEGMMVYDEEADCLKIYTTADGTNFGWKCFNTQACPE